MLKPLYNIKTCICFLMLHNCLTVKASMNCKFWTHSNKVHFSSVTSCNKGHFEFNYKGTILCELINDYIKEQKHFKDHVIINFNPSMYLDPSIYYKLNYTNDSYEIIGNKNSREYNVKAAILNIHDYDFNIMDNFKTIIGFVDSLSGAKTNKEVFNKILQRKIYRKNKITDNINSLDYYFENGLFHFYYLAYDKYSTPKIKSIEIYNTSNVYEFVEVPYNKYLVFENDSTFKYVYDNVASKSILFRWRLTPIDRYFNRASISNVKEEYFEIDSTGYKSMITFDYDYLEDKKAIYIPSENFIMTDYKSFETDNIYQFINKSKHPKNIEKKEKTSNNYLLYLIVGLSVIIHLILFFWKRKKP